MAKGGGSANKSFLYQKTKALLNEQSLLDFCDETLRLLGTAACPPYHLAIGRGRHIGGIQPQGGQARFGQVSRLAAHFR